LQENTNIAYICQEGIIGIRTWEIHIIII
jgi:hypothetical protein